jgi:hypothetical protein
VKTEEQEVGGGGGGGGGEFSSNKSYSVSDTLKLPAGS